jgi:hypothetical protein
MEANYYGLAMRVLQERNPEVFDTSGLDEQLAKGAKERAELNAINDAKRAARDGSDKPENECAKLRRELYVLTERAKNTEIYTNNMAGEVKLLQQRIEEQLKLKKDAALAGNLRGERLYEDGVQRLERELVNVEKEFQRARRVSAGAAIALKDWPHRERVQELEKLVG